MNDFTLIATSWLLRTLFAGGLLLAAAWLLMRLFGNPALREKLAGWAIRGAVLTAVLGLFPAWLTIPVSLTKQEVPAAVPTVAEVNVEPPLAMNFEFEPVIDWVPVEADAVAPHVEEPTVAVAPVVAAPLPAPAAVPLIETLRPWVLIAYGSIIVLGLLQLGFAVLGLVRLRRSAQPVPLRIQLLLPEDAPTVLMSNRVGTPVCFGFRTPTVLLPEALLGTASDAELRWVLAHELDHLRRGDARTGVWVGLARAVYFALPWFWALRRDLRLAQEYLADAAAAAGRNADYAAFLVHLSGPSNVRRHSRAPLAAFAMRPGKTDLFRRVSMLTKNAPRPHRVSRFGSLLTAGGVLAAAIGLSGLGFADDKKPEQQVEVRVIVVDDDAKKDGDKKKDGEKKKDAEKMDVIIKTVKIAGGEDVQKLSKLVSDALEKGDVAAAKDAMAKLNKALLSQPKVMTFDTHGGLGGGMHFVPSAPAAPQTPHAVAGTFTLTAPAQAPAAPAAPAAPMVARIRMVADETVKHMEQKIEALTKALAEVKDSPEAREALEKTIAEFKKKIAEARDSGELKGSATSLKARQFQILELQAQLQELSKKHGPDHPLVEAAKARLDFLKNQSKQAQAPKDGLFEFRAVPADNQDVVKKTIATLRAQIDELGKDEHNAARIKAAKAQLEAIEAAMKATLVPVPVQGFEFKGGALNPLGGKAVGGTWVGAARAPTSGRLGITIEEVPAVLKDQLNLTEREGLIITSVVDNSVAAKANFKKNDILLTIAVGTVIHANTNEVLLSKLRELEPETKYEFVVLRKGKKETLKDVVLPKVVEMKAKVEKSDAKAGDGVQFSSMNVNVNDNEFTINAKNQEITIKIVGNFNDGTPAVHKVTGSRGGVEFSAKDLKDLSKSDRAIVEQLLKNVRGGK